MLGLKELSSVLALGGRTYWSLGCCFIKLFSSLWSLPLLISPTPSLLCQQGYSVRWAELGAGVTPLWAMSLLMGCQTLRSEPGRAGGRWQAPMTALTRSEMSQVQSLARVQLGAAWDEAGTGPSNSVCLRSLKKKGPEDRLKTSCLQWGSDLRQSWMVLPDLIWARGPRPMARGRWASSVTLPKVIKSWWSLTRKQRLGHI